LKTQKEQTLARSFKERNERRRVRGEEEAKAKVKAKEELEVNRSVLSMNRSMMNEILNASWDVWSPRSVKIAKENKAKARAKAKTKVKARGGGDEEGEGERVVGTLLSELDEMLKFNDSVILGEAFHNKNNKANMEVGTVEVEVQPGTWGVSEFFKSPTRVWKEENKENI